MSGNSDTTQILLSSLKRERPVCFRPEEFFDENFNVDTFLALNRKSFTLESLKKDLENYSSTIQNSLVELINRDYADFVNLSTNLVGVDQTILKLEAPLTSIHADIDIIRGSIQAEIEQISEKLVLRSEIRNKQEVLYSLLNINKLTIKIENLISQNTEAKENLFERVASEYSQLNFYISKFEHLPFVQQMLPRIKQIDQYLEGGLYTAFKSGLEAGDKASVTQCLRIFTTLDRVDKSEKLFAESVIAPLLDKLVTKASLNELGLRGVYQNVLDSLPGATSLVLSLTTPRKDNELRSFEFMGNSVFPVVVSKICTNIPSIFAAGNPRQFQQAYRDTVWFLGEFERLTGYRERVVALRQHTAYKTFLAKWSLPIYFQIRLQEIAGSFEHQLLTPFSPAPPDDSPFCLPAPEMLRVCVRRCWDDDVLLKPLTHRFYKLTLQLLKRYAVWLEELPGSSEELQLSDVCRAVLDTTKLLELVPSLVADLVSPRVPSYSPALVEQSCAEIRASLPTLADHVTSHVTESCCKAIDQAQAVPRLYRRTNREMPTEPLAYVAGLTEALEREVHGSCLPEPHRAEWSGRVATAVIIRYHGAISEILISLRKTEDSLAMLKRGRKSAATTTTPSNTTDEDKIRCQLRLDVTALGDKLEEMGIPRGEEYGNLLTLVSQTKR